MVCPICRQDTLPTEGRCQVCKAVFATLPQAAAAGGPFTSGSVPTFSPDMTRLPGPAEEIGQPATADGGPQPGQPFGRRYQIIRLLGIGGMGAVYQAWDGELGLEVALKIIRTESSSASPELEKQIKNELLLARQVTHKNVVRIHDLGTINGIKYITMPYVQGDNLAMVLRRDGKMPLERTLKVARQIALGLEAAHESSVVHRDLKPANIMIGADDH